jgi:hypothetical protein
MIGNFAYRTLPLKQRKLWSNLANSRSRGCERTAACRSSPSSTDSPRGMNRFFLPER